MNFPTKFLKINVYKIVCHTKLYLSIRREPMQAYHFDLI